MLVKAYTPVVSCPLALVNGRCSWSAYQPRYTSPCPSTSISSGRLGSATPNAPHPFAKPDLGVEPLSELALVRVERLAEGVGVQRVSPHDQRVFAVVAVVAA